MTTFDATEIRLLRDLEYTAHLNARIDAARFRIWAHLFSVNPLPLEDSAFVVRSLLQRLARAADRGIDVRVLVGGHGLQLRHSPWGNDEAVGILGGFGVEARVFEGPGARGSHAKYVLVDGDLAIVGSHHWSPRSLGVGGDTSISVRSGELALRLSQRFVRDWRVAPPRPVPAVEVPRETLLRTEWPHLPPARVPAASGEGTVAGDGRVALLLDGEYATAILRAIRGASERIDLSMFYFSTSRARTAVTSSLRDALIAAHRRGVAVSVLLDDDGGGTRYGSRVVNGQVMEALKRAGVNARFDAAGAVNHTKALVVDDRTTFLGSHNWTNNSLRWLHEASIRIDSLPLAALMRSTRRPRRGPVRTRSSRARAAATL